MKRAYSTLEVRAVDDEKRILEGVASTPKIDSYNTILEPQGAQFTLPLPVLYQHNSRQPIGHVIEAKVTEEGIRVKLQIAKAGIAGFIDEAWALISNKLVRGLSVGFDPIEEVFDKTFNGFRFPKWNWLELSTVTIAANSDASINSIRAADLAALAALGEQGQHRSAARINPAGASVQPTGKHMKTLREQIAGAEATRAANIARMKEMTDTAAEAGLSLDEAQEQEYDALSNDVKKLDRHLVRLREQETLSVATARPVQAASVTSEIAGSAVRAVGSGVRYIGTNAPKAAAFTRYAIALYFAQGDRERAAQIVQANQVWMDQTPEVVTALRAPVPVGDTTSSGWASQLAVTQNLASEFIELLRPTTLIGRIPGFRNVPFNVLIPRQTAGTEGDWVGEGARKPVGRMTVDNVEFKFTKIAKIVAITEELARFSNPSAEARVRQDLIEGIQVRMDRTFADPSITASAGIRPASIFNGADTAAAAGTGTIANIITDIKAAIATFVAAELPVDQIVILTTPSIAVGASLLRTTLDVKAFPDMTPRGGMIEGFPVYVSSLVPTGYVEFFIPGEVLLADDGQANIDVSNQATLIMDDGGSPSATNAVNLWQENKIGIRAERFVNWLKRRPDSTYYVTAANWGA